MPLSAIMGDHAGQTEVVFVPKVTKENSAKKVLSSHVMSNYSNNSAKNQIFNITEKAE